MTRKILVLRFSSIGDIVLTTPIIRCLKTQLNTEVHFLTKRSFSSILKSNPYIDKLWTFDKHIDEVALELKDEKFDFVVDLHNNLRTLHLKSKLKIASKAFPKLNFQKWLYVNLKMDVMPDLHVVDRYFESVKPLGVKSDSLGLDFFIDPINEVDLSSDLPLNFQSQYVAFTLGAKFKTKCLPEDKMLELLHLIRVPVVLLGGKEDQILGERLAEKIPKRVFNRAGLMNLEQSASIIKNAKVVVAHDTGLMHIASAFHRPIAVIWGNTTPKIGMAPYRVNAPVHFFEVKNLSCRPCSKIGFQSCPKTHFKCMNNQDLEAVARFVHGFFSETKN
jgi:ADP-heptose:LPS heptosyltransferase